MVLYEKNFYLLKSNNNIIAEDTSKKRIEKLKNDIMINLFLGIPYKTINFKTTNFGKFPILDIIEKEL